jgi:pantoate--beta-alanine ligase
VNDAVVARRRDELSEALAARDTTTAVVMTMGALHAGHRALIRSARELAGADGAVITTIFVNPLQFGVGEDFDRYPRTLAADLDICAEEGVDVVFAPDVTQMYPDESTHVTIDAGPLGRELEGKARPTHFAGVLTVVTKLLNLTVPTYAVFGEKDYQQLTLIRRMVTDLEMPYEIVGVPTVRDADGLAVSSRNRYLTAAQRPTALLLSKALRAGAAAAHNRDAVLAAGQAFLDHPGLDVDYLELRGPGLEPNVDHGPARLLVAARVGATRLIDNVAVELPARPMDTR